MSLTAEEKKSVFDAEVIRKKIEGKSPVAAVLLSIVFPGLGDLYCGNIITGFVFICLGLLFVFVGFFTFGIGFIIYWIIWFFGLISSFISVSRQGNRAIRKMERKLDYQDHQEYYRNFSALKVDPVFKHIPRSQIPREKEVKVDNSDIDSIFDMLDDEIEEIRFSPKFCKEFLTYNQEKQKDYIQSLSSDEKLEFKEQLKNYVNKNQTKKNQQNKSDDVKPKDKDMEEFLSAYENLRKAKV